MFLLVFDIIYIHQIKGSKTNFMVKRDPKRAKMTKLCISKSISFILKAVLDTLLNPEYGLGL